MKSHDATPGRESRQHSPLRIAANRRNALKSTGPRTPGGKRRAALNSRVRGLLSEDVERQLRTRGEDLAEFRRLHRDLLGIFGACDSAGMHVMEQMAATWWEKARRMRNWVAAGPPRSADLDARLEELMVLLVGILRGRRKWWSHRLAAVLGNRIGTPSQVREQIEDRLSLFGARKRDRKYPRKDDPARSDVPPEFLAYVERALQSIVAGRGIPNPVGGDDGTPVERPGTPENEAKRSQMA
jgi:hypothetical protein